MMLVQVRAPHFCAGFVTEDGKVIKAAPIIYRRFIGKSDAWVRHYIKQQGWTAVIVREK
jgi:hypothetical protein